MFFVSPAKRPESEPSLDPVICSAVIFPGLGQYKQRRFGPAMLYGGAALIATFVLGAMLARHGMDLFRLAREAWSREISPEEWRISLIPMLKACGFFLGVYVASLYDTWYAWYRSLQAWRTPPPIPPAP